VPKPTPIYLDASIRSVELDEFEYRLKNHIVGQDDAITALADIYQMYKAKMNSPGRPVGSFLFLGPTGVGKTALCEVLAKILFGTEKAIIKVNCAEFQHSHEIAKIIGSPPGYLGHRETGSFLNEKRLTEYCTKDNPLSILLFDEIEKSSDALWQLLLGILDKATLTLGDNSRVDLSNTMIFLTSNLGGRDITKLAADSGLGFHTSDTTHDDLENAALSAMRIKFSPEFINRLDKIVVFNSLGKTQLQQILDIELENIQERLLENEYTRFAFNLTPSTKEFLLKEGVDIKYGARHLKRAIHQHIVYPLSNLVSSGQVRSGDSVLIDRIENETRFCLSKNALIKVANL
jgi:ATP-dependent Clp protease ATP-binding subunit ClpA